ncbi:uncharacterized protein C4orf54 homolog [Anabas testudineus]|uniref:uncharacterized protein C4orf54 homolog n=1 Tax=Anabas testudineus TaxID=64144 RepID=UPI000E465BBB|nr:uncharacterized protein C4orf54 homolog [Anabas testudineus]XP_026209146.1 uncharacterized protein C4orf54 homolog [Anabas testudineus]XP_026209147.1 uncharacterized protein C4orf54 homolog [Anabas testudineus]
MKTEQSCLDTPVTPREVKDLTREPRHGEEDAPEKQDESRYVDLESVVAKEDRAKTKEGGRFGEISLMSVLINSGNNGALRVTEPNHKMSIETEIKTKTREDAGVGKSAEAVEEGLSHPTSPLVPQSSADLQDCLKLGDKGARVITQPEVTKKEEKSRDTDEEFHRSDSHLSGRRESYESDEDDDDVSLVLSDDCIPCATEDESHYITTHEIQLSELSDHDTEYDLGVGSSNSWDVEDDNQVCSFVDYASLDGDGAVGERGDARQPHTRGAATAAVSTLLESDPGDASKFTSSDESVSKPQQQELQEQQEEQELQQRRGNGGGQIHLSIRTTSRAINDPGNIQEQESILYHARRSGDMSRYVFRGVDGKTETLCDRAKCCIAAPGRLHFGGKLRGKEVTEYSSGASSAVSELDDADKEVRNLTARAFKSLAYPYIDAINFSTSSESSASERGIGMNRWSTFVDLKYGNVNVSRGLDQSAGSHQNKTASFEIAQNIDNRDSRGVALASIKPPPSKILTLNGNPHRASSSTKQIELMGKFSEGHSGVIRLTETLNFRCNVTSGMSGGERRANFAQNAAGSRSTDEVTNNLPSGQRRGASKPHSKTMEDAHKKAIFASSLLKNVISKKMQFEQERRMERGEIREPHQAPSPCLVHQESDSHRGKGSRELHRQGSKVSESGSDYAIMCLDELGDIVDSGSCDAKSDSRRRDDTAPAPETNLEPTNEAGIDTKKGALEACRSTLLRSQNSAFRCWKDEELEFQKAHKNAKSPEEKPPSADHREAEEDQDQDRGKLTKMSHLFVPSIQVLSSDGEVEQQLQSRDYSPCGDECGIKVRSDNTLYVADSKPVTTSKSPEIKINLRSVRENKTEPFGVSKLRAPNIGCKAAALKGECSDKVPHFLVRDIRDNKGKLQTPIHQVRDVRKLVKSSYHFVSLDNNDNKSNAASAEGHSEQKKQMPPRNPNSVSPIVIKCQSVNTNSHGKQCGNLDLSKPELLDTDRSSPEGAKGALLQRATGRTPMGASNNCPEGDSGLRIESKIASRKQEKMSDLTDKKPESKVLNQVALEKLQAAVKTMEQLYVFEKNEWKRRNKPLPLTDSHVLSLLASEEHEGPEEEGAKESTDRTVRRDSYPNMDRTPPAASPSADSLLRREDRDPFKSFQTSGGRDDRLAAKSLQSSSSTSGRKNLFSLSSNLRAATSAKTPQAHVTTQTPSSTRNAGPTSSKLPVSLKISQMWPSGHEGDESKEVDRSAQELSGTSGDSENYLTIPVKTHASSNKQSPADKTPVYTFASQTYPSTPPGHVGSNTEDLSQTLKRSSIVMETCSPEIPSATIYHSLPLGISTNQPQVYCFSPAITPAPTLDPFQATQRKMLLDPTTGNYYLVDTPVQPTTKRLFDPETGQYVDVPMPQPPMTPVHMPISPLALSPGAYGHTYMIYPGFMPTPSVIPARTLVQSQMSVQPEVESGEKASAQHTEGMYMESPFYMATGKSQQAASRAQQQAAPNRLPQGFSSVKQPVISITSQQGPRIIAPPSFDGTTMSFVVEHR